MEHRYRLWSLENLRCLAWLAFLGPFFFISYNFANNAAAAQEPGVPTIVFAWEHHIPFWDWTVVPYWSSDLLYAASFLTCRTKSEIDRLGLRLLTVQCISIVFFVLFPLKLTHSRVPLDGFYAPLFQTLVSFDWAYNMAPSLHVSLAWILWRQFRGPFWGAWFLLVALSTLTTWQHHFIDLPTGLWAGILVVALLPETRRPECTRPKLACFYGVASTALTVAAFWWGWWILLWPAFSLSLVMAAYFTGNVEILGKTPFWMWPYNGLAWLNSKLWRSGTSEVVAGVWVGRPDTKSFRSVVDLTAELPVRADANVPMLDLVPPSLEQISSAVSAISALADRRPTLVCCALGYSRSATAVAAWMLAAGHAETMEKAVEIVRKQRPQAVLGPATLERLTQWAESFDANQPH